MLFNSFHFLIFFPLVVFFYFTIPQKYRWILLLISSYYFYMCWKAEYIILIVISTLIDYFSAIQIHKNRDNGKRNIFLILSLLSNLGLLFSFKYFNFFNNSISSVFKYFNIFYNVPAFSLLLPVGISFYTFQTLSYTIDVYQGKREPERHMGIFAVYVSFFPQLVAGPIERSTSLMPQFFEHHKFEYGRVTSGLKLMAWGFFKKIVIADRLAVLVDHIYNNPTSFTGLPFVLATVFFAFQIYCDFSGYSDIAIGAAEVLGYRLMKNFRRPYLAKSISEFWSRWHISLSTWFRDYLYIPLGGNRVVKWRWYYNLFITFLVSGLWHGANWTFVIWGALNGFYLIFAIVTADIRQKIADFVGLTKVPTFHNILKTLITFMLTCFAWIFFRANTLQDALYIIKNMVVGTGQTIAALFLNKPGIVSSLLGIKNGYGLSRVEIIIGLLSILFLYTVHIIDEYYDIKISFDKKPLVFRWSCYLGIILCIICFGAFGGAEQFIYFQF